MQDRCDRLSRGIDSGDAVPEGVDGDRGRLQFGVAQLGAELVERLGGEVDQGVGIDLEAPIGGGGDVVGDLATEVVGFVTVRAEEERADGEVPMSSVTTLGESGAWGAKLPL